MKMPSLTLRLIIIVFMLFIALLGASTFLIFESARARINKDYDAQLISEAHLLWMIADEENEEPKGLEQIDLDFGAPSMSAQQRAVLTQYTQWRAFRIWKGGELAEQSDTSKALEAPSAPPEFSEYDQKGERWRAYAIHIGKGDMIIEAWEKLDNRDRLLYGIIDEVIEPAVILLPFFTLLLIFGVRYGLRDMRVMAKQLAARNPDDLSKLDMVKIPKELEPLKKSLNSLLDKLRKTLDREQQFIENAAHELKTPLAVLKLQSQLIEEAPTDSDRADCIQALQEGIDRTRVVFDQILTLSRISGENLQHRKCSLNAIVQQIIIERSVIADQKDIEIYFDSQEIEIETNSDIFEIMVGILIDNALKYTPESGKISISYFKDHLEIIDSGIGIPDEEREKVFDRFYRIKGNKTHGSGLGLAIAKKCADILKMKISLNGELEKSGLKVSIIF